MTLRSRREVSRSGAAGDTAVKPAADVPTAQREQIHDAARAKPAEENTESLDAWEAEHRAKIEKALGDLGYA
jgi:hypothetical protein